MSEVLAQVLCEFSERGSREKWKRQRELPFQGLQNTNQN